MRILLDPGHKDGYNPYSGVSGFYEGNQMFKLAGFLKSELEAYGIVTGVTRQSVTDYPNLDERGKMASGYDLMLSLHSNAGGGSYVVIFDSTKIPNKSLADKISTKVAAFKNVQPKVRYKMSTSSGGGEYANPNTNKSDYFSVLYAAAQTDCKSAMIIEHGFHDNADWVSFLIDDNCLKMLAQAEAAVIAEYYGVSKAVDTVTNTVTTGFSVGNTVKVQSGAKYSTGQTPSSWVYNSVLYIRAIDGEKIKVSTDMNSSNITGIFNADVLVKTGGSSAAASGAAVYLTVTTKILPLILNSGYNGKTASGKKLASMPKGSKVELLEKVSTKWYKIKYNGMTGYASAEYLK